MIVIIIIIIIIIIIMIMIMIRMIINPDEPAQTIFLFEEE